jgi:hypothetical protein
LELVATKSREFGVNASVESVDISTSLGQLQVAQRIKVDLTHLDILVLNAATFTAAPSEDAEISLTQVLSPVLKATPWTGRLHQFEQRNCSEADDGAVRFLEARPQGDRRQL